LTTGAEESGDVKEKFKIEGGEKWKRAEIIARVTRRILGPRNWEGKSKSRYLGNGHKAPKGAC